LINELRSHATSRSPRYPKGNHCDNYFSMVTEAQVFKESVHFLGFSTGWSPHKENPNARRLVLRLSWTGLPQNPQNHPISCYGQWLLMISSHFKYYVFFWIDGF
jgi:hypothetical protein